MVFLSILLPVGRSVAGFKVVHLFTVTFGMSSKIVWYLSHRAVDKLWCSLLLQNHGDCVYHLCKKKKPFNLVTWPQPFPCCQGSQGLFKKCIIWNNVRQYAHIPKNDNNCRFVMGFGTSLIAFIRFSEIALLFSVSVTQKNYFLLHKTVALSDWPCDPLSPDGSRESQCQPRT